jgi:hypothetical protein
MSDNQAKDLTGEEFERLSYQHALDNADKPEYKYLNTPQPDDYRFNTYFNMCIEATSTETVITITDKDSRFKLGHVMLTVKNMDEHYSLLPKNKTHDGQYVLRIDKNLTGVTFGVMSRVESVDKNSGLLNMILGDFDITF